MSINLNDELDRFDNEDTVFGPAGYFATRSKLEADGFASLPLADFYEYRKILAKKYWLNDKEEFAYGRIGDTKAEVMPLYRGTKMTTQRIVSFGFFTFSALLVFSQIHMASVSRIAGCKADLWSIRDAKLDPSVAQALHETLLACRVASTIVYEGDGLGGYSGAVWNFYGRLFGLGCPEDHAGDRGDKQVLTDEEAQACAKQYSEASPAGKQELFWEWWNLIHADLQLSRAVVNKLWMGTRLVSRYQHLEAGAKGQQAFDAGRASDVQSVLCGFARRASKGMGEGRSYGADDQRIDRLYDFLWDANAGCVLPQATALFTQGDGSVSDFGANLLDLVPLYIARAEVIAEILQRRENGEENEEMYRFYAAMGMQTDVAKRGTR